MSTEKTRRKILSEAEAGFRRILSSYKSRAKREGISFSLTDWETKLLLAGACHYCGCAPQRAIGRAGSTEDDLFEANGIDRIDNRRGYVDGNVFSACAMCNFMKADHHESVFLGKVRDIYLHLDLANS